MSFGNASRDHAVGVVDIGLNRNRAHGLDGQEAGAYRRCGMAGGYWVCTQSSPDLGMGPPSGSARQRRSLTMTSRGWQRSLWEIEAAAHGSVSSGTLSTCLGRSPAKQEGWLVVF